MELGDNEATKKRILERCGWAELVVLPEEPVTSLLEDTTGNGDDTGATTGSDGAGDDIPEEEEQPNDGSASSPFEDALASTTTSDAAAPSAPEAAQQPADAPATTKKTKK